MSKKNKKRKSFQKKKISHSNSYTPKIVLSRWIQRLIKKIHKHPLRKEKEWSAYMRLLPIEGWYKCVDIAFPEQINSKWHTKITEDWKSEFIDYIVQYYPEQMNQWFCWLHSHNSMYAAWSWEDHQTRNDFRLQSDAFLSIVTSSTWWNQGIWWIYYTGNFDIYSPMRLEFEVDISAELPPENYREESEAIFKEYEALVLERKSEIDAEIENINNEPEDINTEEQQEYVRMLLNAPEWTSFSWLEWSKRFREEKIKDLEQLKSDMEERATEKALEMVEELYNTVEMWDETFSMQDKIEELKDAETKKDDTIYTRQNWAWCYKLGKFVKKWTEYSYEDKQRENAAKFYNQLDDDEPETQAQVAMNRWA